MDARARAAAAIAEAQSDLDHALAEIDAIQTFNPMLVGLVAHSLSNYITVTAATVEMLQLSLRDHENGDVKIWLEGIGHTADLMQHTVSRLVAMSAPRDFPLKLERVNVRVLMERACEYYRRRTAGQHLRITCDAPEDIPTVSGDRVALAVVADNLLANAARVSKPHGTIAVRLTAEPRQVVCTIRDCGPGLSKDQIERLFRAPLTQPVTPEPDAAGTYAVALADEYVRRMGGELWCESEPGGGACFAFRIPAAV
jgi:signal transduction histidine kinase